MSDDEYEPEEEEEQELDLSVPEVVTKYKAAAEITNFALEHVISEIKPGAKVVDICTKGDEFITEKCVKAFNKKNQKGERLEKGLAFPTCISVNSTVCHFSPVASDETVLAEGDVVKIDLGCHIDGFIAVAAHTVYCQADAAAPVKGAAADVITACSTAVEAAVRMMKPGMKTSDIPEVIQKVADAYGVTPVEGVLSHQIKRFVIDGNKVVLEKPTPEMKVEEAVFEENEVFALDIAFSTGEGKPKVLDEKHTTVYKRALDKEYNLKMKASRYVFSEINKKFPTMPFTIRVLEDAGRARLGLVECLNHELLHAYPVLHEKNGELVAHFKTTVLITANGVDKVTFAPLQNLESEKKLEDEAVIKLLQTALKSKKSKKKKAAAAKTEEATPET